MSENRYTYRTVAAYLHISVTALATRAKKLGISATFGFTADDVKRIEDYEPKKRGRQAYGTTVSDLAAEMEGKV